MHAQKQEQRVADGGARTWLCIDAECQQPLASCGKCRVRQVRESRLGCSLRRPNSSALAGWVHSNWQPVLWLAKGKASCQQQSLVSLVYLDSLMNTDLLKGKLQ